MPGFQDRFWAKVVVDGECWLWTAATNWGGYGVVGTRGSTTSLAHRVSYELATTERIPPGGTLDHLCRAKTCVNPAHLEVVSLAENIRRAAASQTHCSRGHELTPENWRYRSDRPGERECLRCQRERRSLRTAAARLARA